MHSYLNRRKQGVKVSGAESVFQILLSSIPQGSMLGLILFNILINILFFFIKDAWLTNFADDSAARNSIEEFIKVLQTEIKSAIGWFKMNDMKVNPVKIVSSVDSVTL